MGSKLLMGLQAYELWAPYINGPANLRIMGSKLLMGLQTYKLLVAKINGSANL